MSRQRAAGGSPDEPVSRGSVRILHIITGLNTGGAEMMLYRLLSRTDRARFSSVVVCLTRRGELADAIEQLQVPVVTLGLGGGHGLIRGLKRLVQLLRQYRPRVIQTWLYHADLVGLIARPFVSNARLCWNLRCAGLKRGDVSNGVLLLRRLLSLFSRVPDVVMVNSSNGQQAHLALGYRPRRWAVLYNGFDTVAYRPDPVARAAVREELSVSDDTPLVGIIARFDPLKDHASFIRAAGRLAASRPRVRIVLVGRGVDSQNPLLATAIQKAGLTGKCHLLGERNDIARIMTALDVVVSTSYSEGFPNTIGEAMACGVACVATDAGDSAFLIGDTGFIVPPRNAEAIASACGALLDMPAGERVAMGQAARKRIEQHFSIDVVAEQYQRIYEEMGSE